MSSTLATASASTTYIQIRHENSFFLQGTNAIIFIYHIVFRKMFCAARNLTSPLLRGATITPTASSSVSQHSSSFFIQPWRSLKTSNPTLKASLESPTTTATTVTVKNIENSSSFMKDHPFKFQLLVATGKTMAADLMVQVVTEGKKLDEIDWKRNGIFVVFGFTYLGGFQYWLMVNKYRQWFPTMDRFAKLPFAEKLKDIPGIIDAGKMVLFDIFVHLPFIYFPTYYTVKEFVSGTSYNPVDWMKDGITKWSKNFQDDFTALVKLWGPSDCVQFILPIHIRMPFRHLVSFFWTAYVSFTRGSIEPKVESE